VRLRARRRVNLALLALLTLALLTGVASYGLGSPGPARLVTIAHALAGFALLALVPWKQVIMRRGLRAGRPHLSPGIVLAVLVATSVVAGMLHAYGGRVSLSGITAMHVHVGAAVLAVPLGVWHVRTRPQRLRRTDMSRRVLVQAGALGVAATCVYAIFESAAQVLSLPGAQRRGTGSHETGSGHPDRMPVTQWFTDGVPSVDVENSRLEIIVAGQAHSVSYADLAAGTDTVRAVLDCTGGWWAVQEWRGVRLDRLLPAGSGRSVEVVSVTGYRRRLPFTDAPYLLLATHVAGRPLSAGHGAPVRLVAPGRRGFWWVKWVAGLEVLDEPWWWQPPFPLK
jgi:hypothetical protein